MKPLFFLLIILFFTSASIFGQSKSSLSLKSVGVGIGYYNPELGYWNKETPWGFDGGWLTTIQVDAIILPKLHSRLSFGYFNIQDKKTRVDDWGAETIGVNLIPASLSLYVPFNVLGLETFVGAGTDITMINTLYKSPESSQKGSGGTTAFHALMGIEKAIGKVAVGIEGKYIVGNYNQSVIPFENSPAQIQKITIDGLYVGLTLKYRFTKTTNKEANKASIDVYDNISANDQKQSEINDLEGAKTDENKSTNMDSRSMDQQPNPSEKMEQDQQLEEKIASEEKVTSSDLTTTKNAVAADKVATTQKISEINDPNANQIPENQEVKEAASAIDKSFANLENGYYAVEGVFKVKTNAENHLSNMKSKGFTDAQIGYNPANQLYYVWLLYSTNDNVIREYVLKMRDSGELSTVWKLNMGSN